MNAAPIFPTGEKSNACRTRLSSRLSTMECREPVCPHSVPLGTSSIQSVVRYLRSLQGQMSETPLTGDPENGKVIFFGRGDCSQCHMANGQGGFMGSDLSSFASTQSPVEIRSAITNPNRNLDPRKRVVIVTTCERSNPHRPGAERGQLFVATSDYGRRFPPAEQIRDAENRISTPFSYAGRLRVTAEFERTG